MPLWFVSCHNRSDEKILSVLFIKPSPLPPLAGLSNSLRARNPFFSLPNGGGGCDVKLPNNSRPLSIVSFLFLSNASQASSEPGAVQDRCSVDPSPFKSKLTP